MDFSRIKSTKSSKSSQFLKIFPIGNILRNRGSGPLILGPTKKITGNDSYTATMHIEQLKKEGGDEGTKKYTFVDVWPSSTGEIALSWDTNEIQTYDITWEFNYWKSAESSVGQ